MPFEYRPQWNVPGAGKTESVFHFIGSSSSLESAVTAIRNYFFGMAGNLPNDVTITFPNEVLDRNTVGGTIVDIHTVTAPSAVTGTNTGSWAGGIGVVQKWETGEVVAGRRLRGRTFLVPFSGNSFDVDGTVAGSVITAVNSLASTLISAMAGPGNNLVVWSQTHDVAQNVVSASMPDRSAILRSRRD